MKKIIMNLAATFALLALVPALASASTIGPIDFESYSPGNINGQNGWSALGSAGSGCAVYDEGVSTNSLLSSVPTSFGNQSFRISNAVTSGCFGDQAFAPALTDQAGESGSNNGSFPSGTTQSHFESQFDIFALPDSLGDNLSVSPDRGDGARMSYLRFENQADGIHVFFFDVQGTSNPANFVETPLGTLTSGVPHTIKFTMDFVDGPSNDVVNIYIDGNLAHTGTSWENYYRFDPESNPSLDNAFTPTVRTILFRSAGTAVPGNSGKGYLIDNLILSSSMTAPTTPTITSPTSGSTLTSAALTQVDWTDSTGTFSPIGYYYEAYSDAGYSSLVYASGLLSSSDIPTPGTPEGTYYIRVRAQDANGNLSDWSNGPTNLYFIIVNNTLPGALHAEDFGVVDYDTGLGILKGYTAGFGVDDNTLAGATSVVVKLYAGSTLLQTNTANISNFNSDITGTQFSSPFDVSGNFDYATDGYWTNTREAQYGQNLAATRVVATVTLANGKIVTAENDNLTGDPITIFVPTPASKDDCKGNGWKGLIDVNGHSFKNQGQCVASVVSKSANH